MWVNGRMPRVCPGDSEDQKALKVFIVDDSPIVRTRLTMILAEIPGVELVGQSQIASEAIEGIQRLTPEVVVLDIRLAAGSGIDVLETIKKDTKPPIVIILTSYPYPQYRKRCAEAGADYFLDKATEFDRVPEILRQLIQNCPVG
jgi:DNA-binding NarL/FixJ family response regulator